MGQVMGVDVHKHVVACGLVSETRILLEATKRNNKAGVAAVIDFCPLFYGALYLNDVTISEEEDE